MEDILAIFDFKREEFKEKQIKALLGMLSKEEKKVFNLLKLSEDALTATQVYEYYIDKILNENPFLNKKIDELKSMLNAKKKKPFEIKAEFARSYKTTVPTNRTVTRVLENLKDAGFVVKRRTSNKKAKAYYCLIPKLKLLLEEQDPEIIKKRELELVKNKLKQIKNLIEEQK